MDQSNLIKTKVVSKKLIKPSTPTQNLNYNYKLSFIDEFIPRMEVGVLLFYAESKRNRTGLEASLAKTLVQFYPLAGRYDKKSCSVHCGDQGAEFVEAEALEVELKDVISERNTERLSGFFPCTNHKLIDESMGPILSIQTTELRCGGMVLGISVYHKIIDASSLGTFIAAWSSNSCSKSSISPIFNLFPSKNQIYNNDVDDVEPPEPAVKVFSFSNDAITSLRSQLGTSRVCAVCAVIVKAVMGLDGVKHGGVSRPIIIGQAVNLRGRTIPPLPRYSFGNLVTQSSTEVTTEIGIEELVGHLGQANKKVIADCSGILSMDENGLYDVLIKPAVDVLRKLSSGEVIMLSFSDWSKFGFYEADFGWGKPVRTSIAAFPIMNMVVLMDSKEGNGIEAWVHLDKNDMSLFEQDEGIRVFTTY